MAKSIVLYKSIVVGEVVLGQGVKIYNQNDEAAKEMLSLVEAVYPDQAAFSKRVIEAAVDTNEIHVDDWFNEPAQPLHDPVNHPKHYTSHPSGIECIEITRHMGFNLGNTVKYIWRDGLKDTEVPLQDLRKALWYLEDEIAQRELKELGK